MSDLLLDDEMSKDQNYVSASNGKRFGNLFIDYIVTIIIGAILALAMDLTSTTSTVDYSDATSLKENLLFISVYLLYYSLTEGLLKGKSLAKFITGTRVINYDGTAPSFGTCFMRSLSRLVPFEPFSFLGQPNHGWHDKWTDTMVIDEKQSTF